MTTGQGGERKKDPVRPPGDDVVPVPPPVDEQPPHDRYCDLVLTGGVASGVVYPWAIVELAREFRFRNIGGTSVGAMAAALAAAAEYGRRTGYEAPFEALRRAPASLAWTLPDGRTRLLSLFQTNDRGQRLIRLWGKIGDGNRAVHTSEEAGGDENSERQTREKTARGGGLGRVVWWTLRIYAGSLFLGALIGAAVVQATAWLLGLPPGTWTPLSIVFVAVGAVLGAALGFIKALWSDIRYGVIENFYGLCKGGTVERPGSDDGPGISEWLHEGIQASAGLEKDDPPLTFRDLWCAPAYPGAERLPCGPDDPQSRRSIDLQMITTNVTHGRPYRLPLNDRNSRLFFRWKELEGYFPKFVLDALTASSRPYAPRSESDPPVNNIEAGWLELPEADMPVVVAARLSLSFPVLFSAVPLGAIDYEAPRAKRTVRRCLFSDGGVSSNFPIHLFDASVPRWPTFGLWLERRPPYKHPKTDKDVWLPEFNGQGWGDNWNRFDPKSKPGADRSREEPERESSASQVKVFVGFLSGLITSATDWRDRASFRLAHTRNRVARIMLLPGEGGLHIGMPREQILEMAHRYGTTAGKKFVDRFKEHDGRPSRAWSEQRWIRFNLMVNGLRERLGGLAACAAWSTSALPMSQAITLATQEPGPVADLKRSYRIDNDTAAALQKVLLELERLGGELRAQRPAFTSPPEPELRLRPPL